MRLAPSPAVLILLLFLTALPTAQGADRGAERVRSALQARFPDAQIDMPHPSSIPGYYEVTVGSQVLYASHNGRYLIVGDLIDLQQDANLSELKRMALRRDILDSIDPSQMVVMGPEGAGRHLTVFTNVDCQFCRNMHRELKTLAAGGGVQVRYVLLPEGRADSGTYAKTLSVLCAPNRLLALDKAMAGGQLPRRQCAVPVSLFLNTARKLNVRGLPTTVLDNGMMLSGFASAPQLERILQVSPAVDE